MADLVSRSSVEESFVWLEDWRAGEFTPAYDSRGWPIEMHGLATSYEELAVSYLQLLTALEQVRRTGAAELATTVLGPRQCPGTTATEDDGEGDLGDREGWEVRLRFTDAHEDEARAVFEQLTDLPYSLHRAGVRTLWLHELVWVRTPYVLKEPELHALSRRFVRL